MRINHFAGILPLLTFSAFLAVTATPQQAKRSKLEPKQIAKKTMPSVVVLEFDCGNGKKLLGSGFFVKPELVATNRHVTCSSNGTVRVVNQNIEYQIESVWPHPDESRDLALVKIKDTSNPVLPLGRDDSVSVGDRVFAVGNPQGLEGTFSEGLIGAIRPRDGLIQFSAPISQGSSGGPIVNEFGQVVGISTSYLSNGQNLNFGIQVSYLRSLLSKYEHGEVAELRVPVVPAIPPPLKDTSISRPTPSKPTTPPEPPYVWNPADPVMVALLFDCTEKQKEEIQFLEGTVRRFLNNFLTNKGDQTAVFGYKSSSEFEIHVPFTNKESVYSSYLSRLKYFQQITKTEFSQHLPNGTAIFDAAYKTLSDHFTTERQRKLLIIFAGGNDISSSFRPQQVIDVAKKKYVRIYCILARGDENSVSKTVTPLAEKTGGKIFICNYYQEIIKALDTIKEIEKTKN